MAQLSAGDLALVDSRLQSDLSKVRETLGLLKEDLRAAISAVDSWVDANAASYNSAIPLPARTVLTSRQKAMLLLYVVNKRFEVI